MLSRITLNIVKKSICNNARTLYGARGSLQSNLLIFNSDVKQNDVRNHCKLYTAKRFKSSRRKKAADKKNRVDEDSDEEDEKSYQEDAPEGSKVMTTNIQSRRLDAIAKIGFGISRSKVEEMFYASKIRLNGQKVLKKSKELDVGDEVDLILHRYVDNPKFLVINRIMLLSMNPATNDSIRIKLSKEKNLLIEDYEESWSET